MTNGQQHDIDELRTILERRIRHLQKQQAELGLLTPSHILEDLAQAERDLAGLAVVAQPRISPEVLDAVPPSERERATFAALLDLMEQVASLKRDALAYQERDAIDREKRRQETDQYRSFIEQHIRRLWMSVAANATATIAAWLFGRRALVVRGAPLPPLWRWVLQAYLFIGVGLVWHLRTKYGLWVKL
jgi:hypothetical protein